MKNGLKLNVNSWSLRSLARIEIHEKNTIFSIIISMLEETTSVGNQVALNKPLNVDKQNSTNGNERTHEQKERRIDLVVCSQK